MKNKIVQKSFESDSRTTILLKEYEMCEQQNATVGNWIWTSSTIFASAWIAGLALISSRESDLISIWILAGASVPSQFVWIVYLMRCFRIMDVLEERQRQIELQLGMTKGNLVYLRANYSPRDVESMQYSSNYQEIVREAIEGTEKTVHPGGLEKFILRIWESVFKPWIGGEGEGALYSLSIIISIAWLAYAILASFRG